MPTLVFPLRLLAFTLVLLTSILVIAQENKTPARALPPFQLISVEEDQLPKLLEGKGKSAYVKIGKKEFETLLAQAKGPPATAAPLLAKAIYQARFSANSLVGNGQWTLLGDTKNSGLFPLTSCNLALKKLSFNGKGANAGEFQKAQWLLYVPAGKEQKLDFEWSTRLQPKPEGYQADLKIPPGGIASLEIALPQGWVLLNQGNGLVEGPIPAGEGENNWRIVCSGEQRIEFLIQDLDRGSVAPKSTGLKNFAFHKLEPVGASSEFRLEWEGGNHGAGEILFDLPEQLRLTHVEMEGMQAWEVKVQNGKETLVVKRERNQGGVLKARGIQPFKNPWSATCLRVKGALPSREEIRVEISPALELLALDQGSYLVLDASEDSNGVKRTGLVGGGLAGSGGEPMPAKFFLKPLQAEFLTRQLTLMDLTPRGLTLTSQIAYQVLQGTCPFLLVDFPSSFEVEEVSLEGGPAIKDWVARKAGAGQQLRVELESSLTPESGEKQKSPLPVLNVTLFSSSKSKAQEWNFPALRPVGPRANAGFLGIAYDRATFQVETMTQARAVAEPFENPGFKSRPNLLFTLLDRPLEGKFKATVRPGRVKSNWQTRVTLADNALQASLALQAQAETGFLDTFDFTVYSSEKMLAWKEPQGKRLVRKLEVIKNNPGGEVSALLASRNPLQFALTSFFISPAQRFRATLAQPLTGNQTVKLESAHPIRLSGPVYSLPWIRIPLSESAIGETRLELPGVQPEIQAPGWKPMAQGPPGGRSFQQEIPMAPITLQFSKAQELGSSDTVPATLNCFIKENGDVMNHFAFFAPAGNGELPLVLPEGSRLLSVRVQGKPFSFLKQNAANQALLPIGNSSSGQETLVEIVYQTYSDQGYFLRKHLTELPVFPFTVKVERMVYALPSGWQPLSSGFLPPAQAKRKSSLFDSLMAWWLASPMEAWKGIREQDVARLDLNKVRVTHSPEFRDLGGLVRSISETVRMADAELLIDKGTLELTKYSRRAPLPDPVGTVADNLEALGLTVVPLGGNWLVTTREGALHQTPGKTQYLPAWRWLYPPENLSGTRDKRIPFYTHNQETWEIATELASGPFYMVNGSHIRAAGLFFALLSLLVIRVGRVKTERVTWKWAAWFLLGCFSLALPASLIHLALWSFLVFSLSLLIRYFYFLRGPLPAVATTAAFFFFCQYESGLIARAQETEPYPVYLLRGTEEQPGSVAAVFLPEKMFRELQAHSQPLNELRPAITLSHCLGRAAEPFYFLKFQCQVFATETGELELPFNPALISGDILFSGEKAFPRPGPQGQVLLPVQPGNHQLELELRYPIRVEGGWNSISFQPPAVMGSEFKGEFAPGYDEIVLQGGLGLKEIRKEGNKTVFSAELGKTLSPVTLRWKKGPLPPAAMPQIQEAYLWDLRADSSNLNAFLSCRVPGPGTEALYLDVPEELTVTGAVAQGGDEPTPRIGRWSRTPSGKGSRWGFHFLDRIQGEVLLQVQLTLIRPVGGGWKMPLPEPALATIPGVSFLAYRVQGCKATSKILPLGVTGIANNSFAPFWKGSSKPESETLTYACSFRRVQGKPPELVLDILPTRPTLVVRQLVYLSPNDQDQSQKVKITVQGESQGDPVPFLNWHCEHPGRVLIRSIQGEQTSSWTRQGNDILIWFKEPARSFTLEIEAQAFPIAESREIQAPVSRFPQAEKVSTQLTLGGPSAESYLPTKLTGLALVPALGDLRFQGEEKNYLARFLHSPKQQQGKVKSCLWADAEDKGTILKLEALVPAQAAGKAGALQLRVKNWPTQGLTLDLPPGVKKEEKQLPDGDRVWTFSPPAGSPQWKFSLKGLLPWADFSKDLPLPQWNFEGITGQIGYYSLPPTGLRPATTRFCKELTMKEIGNESLPGAWSGPGQERRVFKIESTAAEIVMEARKVQPTGPPRLFHVEREVVLQANGPATHRAQWWVFLKDAQEVPVGLPAGAENVRFWIEQEPVQPVATQDNQYLLPVENREGLQRVRAEWMQAVVQGKSLTPSLPLLGQGEKVEVTWTLRPQGMEIMNPDAKTMGLMVALQSRAKALLTASSFLLQTQKEKELTTALAAIQAQFYYTLQRAEALARLQPDILSDAPWWNQLAQENQSLMAKAELESMAATAQSTAKERLPAEREAYRFAQIHPFDFTSLAKPFTFTLQMGNQPVWELQKENSAGSLGPWVAWLLLGVFSFLGISLPQANVFMRKFWPEQILLFALLIWLALGWSVVTFSVGGVAMVSRLFLWGRSAWQPSPHAAVELPKA